MTPSRLYRVVAQAEAVTWALLLLGMFLKYGTGTTELGVRVFGMLHGFVFLAYCVTTVLVAVDQRWSLSRLALGLFSAVPPFATIPFERYAERAGLLADRWRLRAEPVASHGRGPLAFLEAPAGWMLRRPVQGVALGAAAVVGLFAAALVAGPPV